MRSERRRWRDRFRDRLRISSWCLTSTDSATTERAPPGPTSRASVASRWRKRIVRSRTGTIVARSQRPRSAHNLAIRQAQAEKEAVAAVCRSLREVAGSRTPLNENRSLFAFALCRALPVLVAACCIQRARKGQRLQERRSSDADHLSTALLTEAEVAITQPLKCQAIRAHNVSVDRFRASNQPRIVLAHPSCRAPL